METIPVIRAHRDGRTHLVTWWSGTSSTVQTACDLTLVPAESDKFDVHPRLLSCEACRAFRAHPCNGGDR